MAIAGVIIHTQIINANAKMATPALVSFFIFYPLKWCLKASALPAGKSQFP
jgi:hypothetical protein